jgi:hypothetical protein
MFDDLRKQPRFRAMGTSGNIVKIPSLLLLNISFVQQDSPNADIVQHLRWLVTRSKIQTLHTLKGPNISGSWSLIQQVHDTCKLDCTKINDKVQIAINFSGLPLYWEGSVSSEDDVYWIFIVLALAANEALVLGFKGPPLQLRHSNGVVGPSWAHRSYSTKGEGRFPIDRDDLGISSLTPEYLDVDLLFLQKEGQKPPNLKAQSLADKILRENNLYDRKVSVPDPLKQRGVDSLLFKYNNMPIIHDALCDTVACFIDGGGSWMKSAWDIFHTELIQETTKDDIFYAGFFGSFDESISFLSSAAETILDFHGINEDTPDLKEQFLPSVFGLLALVTDGRFRRYLQ